MGLLATNEEAICVTDSISEDKRLAEYYLLNYENELKKYEMAKEEFINSLNEMSILEIKELVDAMKEAYGVDPSAVAVAGPAVAAVEEGPSKVNVVLTAAGANKIAVIKLVRDLTGLGLKEAKDIADNGGNVKEGIDKEEAEKIKAQFEEAGATVELK